MIVGACTLIAAPAWATTACLPDADIIPAPANRTFSAGAFTMDAGTKIIYESSAEKATAEILQAEVKARNGWKWKVLHTGKHIAGAVVIESAKNNKSDAEDYSLTVCSTQLVLQATSDAGLFYAVQSLLQMADARGISAGRPVTLPAIHITDAPHFAWRGLLLDESDHFYGKQTVEELLDAMVDQIHTADCRELLAQIPDGSVDAIITDPPYGVGQGRWDTLTEELATFIVRETMRLLKPTGSFFWFGHNETTAEMWPVFKPLRPRWLTWFYRNSSNIAQQTFGWNSQVIVYGHKGNPVFNLDAGRIAYSPKTSTSRVSHDDSSSQYGIRRNGKIAKTVHELGRKPMDVLEFPAVTAGVVQAEGRWHPTQKPLALMRQLVAVSTDPGSLVVDPFCGGGTTCLAARQLGRQFIGIERDAEFARKCRQRLAGA